MMLLVCSEHSKRGFEHRQQRESEDFASNKVSNRTCELCRMIEQCTRRGKKKEELRAGMEVWARETPEDAAADAGSFAGSPRIYIRKDGAVLFALLTPHSIRHTSLGSLSARPEQRAPPKHRHIAP